ncbi:MAG: asparagine synthase (glutamine-hydrolyzing) [Gemmataceae bacterium]
MCGIAGAIDLTGNRRLPRSVLESMADAIYHRGPDEDGFFLQDAVAMASRRLSIVGLADGQQPISNETGDVTVVYNGELFDFREKRHALETKGHKFRTSCDTELIPHLWEQYGEKCFDHMKGQFAFALWDRRQQRFILARDRFGICPLYWTRQGDWLLFASEIKALLASGMVEPRPNPRGINHVFTFFAMPGPITAFEGISALTPGHYLDIRPMSATQTNPAIHDRIYWELDFPEQGDEVTGDSNTLIQEFENKLLGAVEKRLRADVPVVSYLSGGVDSSIVVAMANKIRREPIRTFTIQIDDPLLDETSEAAMVARHVASHPAVLRCGAEEVSNTYPRLVRAAESPVIDTSCAALLLLAEQVNRDDKKVALTGEGADEWLGSYPWFKIHKLLSYLDVIPGIRLSQKVRNLYLKLSGSPRFDQKVVQESQAILGGHNGWLDIYGVVSAAKLRFFNPYMREVMAEGVPLGDIGINTERLRKWHPFHRSVYVGGRIHLPGLLLHAKGDRVAMNSSVETRYPFLDEDVYGFLASLHPKWKLRGIQRDKHILRLLAERWLPKQIARRRKAMFRAPFDSFHLGNPPKYVDQLFSRDSLIKSGYFDVDAVLHWREHFKKLNPRANQRLSIEMGLVGIFSTQLWHHLFIDSSLCELPGLNFVRQVASA